MTDVKEKKLRKLLYALSGRLLAFLGLFFVTSALFVSLLYSANLKLPISLEILAFLGLMLAGYFLQALWCAVIGFRRPESTISYESLEKSYSFRRTIPVIAVAIAVGLAIKPYVQQRLIFLSQTEEYYYYDENSFIPYLAVLFVVGAIFSGSLSWFLHPERILTGRGVVVSLIIMALSIVITVNIGKSATVFQSVCVIGFTCCWMFAMNRQALRNTLASDKAPHPGANVISYNTTLTALLLVAALLLLGLFYIIISGIKTMIMLLLAVLLSAGEGQDGWSEELPNYVSGINQGVFGKANAQESAQYWFMILTFFILAGALILYLSRRTKTVKDLFGIVFNFIQKLLSSLFNPIMYFLTVDTEGSENIAFQDEEEKLKMESGTLRTAHGEARTWTDFLNTYKILKTPEDRYRYAYAEYIRIMRQNHILLKSSDTPRETCGKLQEIQAANASETELENITAAFEQIDFACLPADGKMEKATKVLLRDIKHYIN